MGEIEPSRSLTQSELAAVLRRAAELDAEAVLPVPSEGLDPLVVEAAAIEAGLSPVAVRQAMREVLHPDPAAPDVYDQGGLLPARELVMVREVPGSVREVEDRIGRFLRRQVFVQKRIFAEGSTWEPRRGWAASIRRGTDPGGRLVLKQVDRISISVTDPSIDRPADEDPSGGSEDATPGRRVQVRLVLDVSPVRGIHSAWLAGGAVSGAAVVGLTGVLVGIDPVALAALPAAGGLTAGGHLVGRWNAQHEIRKIHTGLAGLLDRLEFPDRDRPGRQSRVRSGRRRTGTAGGRDRTRGET